MIKTLGRRNISRSLSESAGKYLEGCKDKKPDYDCPHTKELSPLEQRELKRRANVHPFLRKECKTKQQFWKKIFIFVCLPSVILAALNVMYIQPKTKRLPYVEYPHLRIRTKSFPWKDGNKTLFHNPELNALPGGYETEDEEDDE